jgi:hypothetical protein
VSANPAVQHELLHYRAAFGLEKLQLAIARKRLRSRDLLFQLSMIKSGDIILPLLDGRQLRLRRISRPDSRQAEILIRLGIDLPDRLGHDTVEAGICSTDHRLVYA